MKQFLYPCAEWLSLRSTPLSSEEWALNAAHTHDAAQRRTRKTNNNRGKEGVGDDQNRRQERIELQIPLTVRSCLPSSWLLISITLLLSISQDKPTIRLAETLLFTIVSSISPVGVVLLFVLLLLCVGRWRSFEWRLALGSTPIEQQKRERRGRRQTKQITYIKVKAN